MGRAIENPADEAPCPDLSEQEPEFRLARLSRYEDNARRFADGLRTAPVQHSTTVAPGLGISPESSRTVMAREARSPRPVSCCGCSAWGATAGRRTREGAARRREIKVVPVRNPWTLLRGRVGQGENASFIPTGTPRVGESSKDANRAAVITGRNRMPTDSKAVGYRYGAPGFSEHPFSRVWGDGVRGCRRR